MNGFGGLWSARVVRGHKLTPLYWADRAVRYTPGRWLNPAGESRRGARIVQGMV